MTMFMATMLVLVHVVAMVIMMIISSAGAGRNSRW
jgi:hypothetical protein